MRKNITLRQHGEKRDSIGHFEFSGITVPFYDAYGSYNGRSYLVDEKYIDDIKKVSKNLGKVYEDIYSDSGDSEYINGYITNLYLTTNFPGKIEVCFVLNIPIDKVRDIKLNMIINE